MPRADCPFVEDTAVVLAPGVALRCRIGTPERVGEAGVVSEALTKLGYSVQELPRGATLDGGDILALPGGGPMLVGLSRRSNAAGADALATAAAAVGKQVLRVPVPTGLHLKSAMSALDERTLLFSAGAAGNALRTALLGSGNGSTGGLLQPPACGRTWAAATVPDPVAANVLLLRVGSVVMQAGCASSEELLRALCGERNLPLHVLPRMTEFIKADGALTCCSILLPSNES